VCECPKSIDDRRWVLGSIEWKPPKNREAATRPDSTHGPCARSVAGVWSSGRKRCLKHQLRPKYRPKTCLIVGDTPNYRSSEREERMAPPPPAHRLDTRHSTQPSFKIKPHGAHTPSSNQGAFAFVCLFGWSNSMAWARLIIVTCPSINKTFPFNATAPRLGVDWHRISAAAIQQEGRAHTSAALAAAAAAASQVKRQFDSLPSWCCSHKGLTLGPLIPPHPPLQVRPQHTAWL
jgi:hypothetical protein